MGEVLFYRGLFFAIILLILFIVYKIVHPWVKAGCIKLELEGEEVLKHAGEEGEEDNSPKHKEKGVKKGSDWGGLHEVSEVAKEAKKVLKADKKV
jgi:hypothetical protein